MEKSCQIDQGVGPPSRNEKLATSPIGRVANISRTLVWLATLVSALSMLFIALSQRSMISQVLDDAGYNGANRRAGFKTREGNICLTPACVNAASGILENLHPEHEKIDACTDFDQLVCGGFSQRHDMRRDQRTVSPISIMAETSKTMLRHILEGPQLASINYDEDNFAKLKAVYDACMDEESIKALGLRPLEDIIKAVEEMYPGDSVKHHKSHEPQRDLQRPLGATPPDKLSRVVEYLATFDVDAFVQFEVSSDDRDPDNTVLFIYGSSLSLPSKEYYEEKSVVDEYREVARTVLGDVLGTFQVGTMTTDPGRQYDINDYKALVNSVVNLEIQLAKASPPAEEQEDVTKYYNSRSLKEAQSLIPQVSLSRIISNLNPSHEVPDRVIVTSPSYLERTSTLLNDTSEDVVQAFLVWKAVQRYAPAVEDPTLEPWKRFRNTIRGQDPDAKPERWQTCIDASDSQLGWILSKYFVDAAFSEASKNFGDQIIHDIKTRFILTLNSTSWMTPSVRSQAIEKVNNIIQKIGYPTKSPDLRNSSSLAAYYASLTITNRTGYFTNMYNSAAFEVKRGWSALGRPTNRDEWDMTAPTVNAYYNPPGNEIVFPAGIMQRPVFYDPSVPKYLTYGAFGSVAGHELSHAFDSAGRLYDQTGNYTDWWDAATVGAFRSRAQCFVDQYSNFTLPLDPDVHLNGRLTLGENIADAGGVAAAFAAWKRHEHAEATPPPPPTTSSSSSSPPDNIENHRRSGEDLLLPGLAQSFTKDQLFFVSYAGFWCGKERREWQREMALRDPHSPGWARIRGTMNNSREFREAFGCPVKEETCKLW